MGATDYMTASSMTYQFFQGSDRLFRTLPNLVSEEKQCVTDGRPTDFIVWIQLKSAIKSVGGP